MSIFSFGKQKSRQSAVAESQGRSSGFGLNLGSATSTAESVSGGFSRQGIAFQDVFQNLFGGAESAAGRVASLVPAFQSNIAELFGRGTEFMDRLGGGEGADFLRQRLQSGGMADERIGQLGGDIDQFLRERILPGIAGQGVATGTLGGGRQGVAEGLAARGATEEFARGATAIRSEEQGMLDAIASQLGVLEQQGAQTGLAGLEGLAGLAEAGMGAELAPFGMLSQIIGGPTVLTESEQFSTSLAQSLSEQFGISMQEAEDFARSVSSGKSSGFNIGF